MSARINATNSIPPLDGEGGALISSAPGGVRQRPHPSVARATPDLPTRGRYEARRVDSWPTLRGFRQGHTDGREGFALALRHVRQVGAGDGVVEQAVIVELGIEM